MTERKPTYSIGYYYLITPKDNEKPRFRSAPIHARTPAAAFVQICKDFPLIDFFIEPDGTTEGDVVQVKDNWMKKKKNRRFNYPQF